MKLNKWIVPLLLPIQILLIKWASNHSQWIETNYSQGIYPKIAAISRGLLGKIPFSIGDILYLLLIINILAFIFKKVLKRKVSLKQVLFKSTYIASVAYFLFHALWGLNYYRKPLHEILDIKHQYSTENLEKITYKLIERSNALHKKLEIIDSLPVNIPYSTEEIFTKTSEAYVGLKQTFPALNYTPRSIKKSLISTPLTYMGFSGYLNPFTNEAQVSKLILPYKMPTTSCHEEAHQLGFAKENEANFIGSMACMKSPDTYFNYSGYTFALRYCIHELYRRDQQKGVCAIEKVRKGILKNYKEVSNFWVQYENPTEPLFKLFYSQFLKINNQAAGIKSYSYVVALLVNYFEKYEL